MQLQCAGFGSKLKLSPCQTCVGKRAEWRTTRPSASRCRKREDRKARLQKKYDHLRFKGHLEAADSVINKFLNMLEINAPRWVPWDQCPSFSQEEQSYVKVTRTKWLPDAKGAVVERSLRPEPLADVSTAFHIHLRRLEEHSDERVD